VISLLRWNSFWSSSGLVCVEDLQPSGSQQTRRGNKSLLGLCCYIIFHWRVSLHDFRAPYTCNRLGPLWCCWLFLLWYRAVCLHQCGWSWEMGLCFPTCKGRGNLVIFVYQLISWKCTAHSSGRPFHSLCNSEITKVIIQDSCCSFRGDIAYISLLWHMMSAIDAISEALLTCTTFFAMLQASLACERIGVGHRLINNDDE